MSPAPAPPLPARTVPRTGERRRPSPRGAGTGAPAAATAPRHGAAAAPATPIALGGRGPTAEAPEAAPTAAAQAPAAVPAYLGGGGTEGGTEAGAGAGPPPAMAGPELLMPEPPEGLSAEERERIDQAEQEAGAAAATTSAMPSAEENVAGARAAVEEPEAETNARAAAALTEAMGERAAPSPEIEALCERIQEAIRRRRPPDEDSLLEFDPREATQAAGDELNASVQGQSEQVQSTYDQLQEEPSGDPAQEAQSLEPPPERVETPEVNAEAAVPDAVPAEDVSLDADVAASEARVSEAGMTTAPAELITDPDNPVSQAREGQAGLMEAAARAPQEVLAEQSAVREQARGAMQGLQARTLAALEASRAVTAGAVGGGMVAMGGSEAQMRTHASTAAQTIFNEARDQVRALLEPLPRTALERWQSGITVLSTEVEQESERFNTWKRERYAGISGTALQVVELFTGVPDWAVDWLNSIEENFGRRVCNLLREISVEVNTVIATCEEIISNANSRIAAVFAALPESLREWAAGEQANFSAQLEGLREEARSTGADFNRQISQEASQAVQSVRERIHTMREEAQGLLGQIAGAIDRFIEDPGKFIIEGLLKLVGISPAAFWGVVNRIGQVINDIADDPLGFANNLAQALGQGFSQFFDNFGTHILSGFFEWLFSGLGSVGVQLPADFSLGSLITFFLQLMGITWERIRGILARHIGEENVALLERAYELIAVLIEQGPVGIFEMIKEQLNPQTILDQILSSAVDFLIEALIRAVTPRIIAMFNPAGAIVQAIEVIFRILKWIFENAARIFALVETVVNGAAELIAGNFSGMANAVEGALARLIAPVIDFLAGFLGLGNLPDRIADTIRGFQEMVLRIIDRVVAWIAQRARALLSRLGIGREDEAQPRNDLPEDPEERLSLAISEMRPRLRRLLDDGETEESLQVHLHRWKTEYRLRELALVDGKVIAGNSPTRDVLDVIEANRVELRRMIADIADDLMRDQRVLAEQERVLGQMRGPAGLAQAGERESDSVIPTITTAPGAGFLGAAGALREAGHEERPHRFFGTSMEYSQMLFSPALSAERQSSPGPGGIIVGGFTVPGVGREGGTYPALVQRYQEIARQQSPPLTDARMAEIVTNYARSGVLEPPFDQGSNALFLAEFSRITLTVEVARSPSFAAESAMTLSLMQSGRLSFEEAYGRESDINPMTMARTSTGTGSVAGTRTEEADVRGLPHPPQQRATRATVEAVSNRRLRLLEQFTLQEIEQQNLVFGSSDDILTWLRTTLMMIIRAHAQQLFGLSDSTLH